MKIPLAKKPRTAKTRGKKPTGCEFSLWGVSTKKKPTPKNKEKDRKKKKVDTKPVDTAVSKVQANIIGAETQHQKYTGTRLINTTHCKGAKLNRTAKNSPINIFRGGGGVNVQTERGTLG